MSDGRPGPPLLLYDGVCALCNGAVKFILRRDRRREVRFAALQGATAASVLARRPALRTVDSMVWIDPGGEVSIRSDAAIAIGRYLGGSWGLLASLARAVPRPLRDWAYDRVAQVRYRVFGEYDVCPLPPPEHRARFLD